jgi:hypothetical protein
MDPKKDQAGSPPADSITQPDVNAVADSSPVVDAHADSSPPKERKESIEESPSEYQDGLIEAIHQAVPDADDADAILTADEGEQAEAEDQEEEDAETEPEAEEEAEVEDEAEPEPDEEQKDEQLPFGKHPRFKQVIRERNEYRNMAEEYRPHAEEYRKIESFMEHSNLQPQEVAQGFEIMALMKNDPFAARERLMRYVQVLDEVTGNSGLPPDLQQEVARGYMSEQRAREMAQLRNRTQFTQQQMQEQQVRAQEMQARQAYEQNIESQRQAVNAWEAEIAKRDPDYSSIQNSLRKEVTVLSLQNRPQSPDEAVALVKQAYDNVKQEQRRWMRNSRPSVRQSVDSSMAGNSPSARPEPKSFLDAVLQAVDT